MVQTYWEKRREERKKIEQEKARLKKQIKENKK